MNKKEIAHNIKELVYDMYQAGYVDGSDMNLIGDAYQEGLNDAWDCFKKLVCPNTDGGLSTDDLGKIFGTVHLIHIVRNFSPSEVIQKFQDYEEQQKQADAEIRVGDEVYVIDENNKSVVTNIFNASHGPVAMLLSGDAKWIDVGLQYLNKTGKHYDAIEEVLKELRGDEDADSN